MFGCCAEYANMKLFIYFLLLNFIISCNSQQNKMKEYEVTLNGQNFKIKTEDGVQTVGFYVIRVVKAISIQQAEQYAIERLQNDPELTELTVNEKQNPPMIYIEDVNLLPENHEAVNTGFSFYSEETE